MTDYNFNVGEMNRAISTVSKNKFDGKAPGNLLFIYGDAGEKCLRIGHQNAMSFIETICPTDTALSKDVAITLPAARFAKVVSSLDENASGRLRVKADGSKSGVSFSCGRYRASFPYDTGEFAMTKLGDSAKKLNVSGQKLSKALSIVSPAMAKGEVRFYLNGALVEITEEAIDLVATDGHRLITARLDEDLGEVPSQAQLLLPRELVGMLTSLLDDTPVTIRFNSNLVQIQQGADLTIVSKLIDGRYPDWRSVVPKGVGSPVTLDTAKLEQALNLMVPVAEETKARTKNVSLEFTSGEIRLTATNQVHEECEDFVPFEGEVSVKQIGFSVPYLVAGMKAVGGDRVRFHLTSENGALLLDTDSPDNQTRAVVMPVRL